MQNPFELITDDEVIYQMCKSWDNSMLLNMSEAYPRVSRVCVDIIKERKEKYLRSILPDLDLINTLLPYLAYNGDNQIETDTDSIIEHIEDKMDELDLEKLKSYIGELEDIRDVALSIRNLLISDMVFKHDFWITDEQDLGSEIVEQKVITRKGIYSLVFLIQKMSNLHSQPIKSVQIKGFIGKIPAVRLLYEKELYL